MPKRKRPKVIAIEELRKKRTRDLLSYLKKLQRCEGSYEDSDMDNNIDLTDHETIYFKNTNKWTTAYKDVKSILDNREHIAK